MGTILRRFVRRWWSRTTNLAVLGERWRVPPAVTTRAFILVGTGIGAIVSEGVLHRGHRSLAGEIALMYGPST
jgi:predicted NBD/HSP70 family sugar kinase